MVRRILNRIYRRLVPYRRTDLDHQDTVLALRRVGNFSIIFRPNTTDEKVLAHSFENDIFYTRMPEYSPAKGDVILDIGAHIGTFTLLSASKAPDVIVHAVEACRETCDLLRMNAAINPTLNVSVHHTAISDLSGECRLHYAPGNWGHSITKGFSDAGETVKACTLKELLSTLGVTTCHLAKFNCEGAEFPIIMSSTDETLLKISTYLVLYHNELWDRHSNEDLVRRFSGLGYNVRTLRARGDHGWIIATRAS